MFSVDFYVCVVAEGEIRLDVYTLFFINIDYFANVNWQQYKSVFIYNMYYACVMYYLSVLHSSMRYTFSYLPSHMGQITHWTADYLYCVFIIVFVQCSSLYSNFRGSSKFVLIMNLSFADFFNSKRYHSWSMESTFSNYF